MKENSEAKKAVAARALDAAEGEKTKRGGTGEAARSAERSRSRSLIVG